jgi:hypothetical protein
MAKPKKQQTKSTETNEIMVATVDLPKTPEQAMEELVELSQELGLYDITDNPLVKDYSTVPIEASTEVVESVQGEINTDVAKEPTIDSSIAVEPLNSTVLVDGIDYQQSGLDGAIVEVVNDIVRITTVEGEVREFIEPLNGMDDDGVPIDLSQPLLIGISITPAKDEKQMVKNGWGEPLPSLVVTITKSYLRETVAELLYIASLGGELDTSMLPTIRIPFICKMLLPESKYQDYVDRKDYPVFEQEVSYNTVLVKSFDRFDFFKTLVSVGKTGGFIKPRSEVVSGSKLMCQVLTHQPVAYTFSTKVGVEKVKYTASELESFTIEQLRAVGNWYNIANVNSKAKYVKQIMEVQNAR